MPETPDTTNFLILGLGAVFVFVIGYIGTLFVRQRNLQKDRELIEQLEQEDS